MVQIQSSDALEAIRDSARISFTEALPTNLDTSKVSAVLDMTPQKHRKLRVASATRTSSGSGTVLSASGTRQTYIVGFMMSLAKDATADAVSGDPFLLRATVAGVTTSIGIMSITTTIADRRDVFISLPYPVLIDKSTTVFMTGAAFTVGVLIRSAVIYYYETD